MKKIRKILIVLSAALALSACLAGCASGGGKETEKEGRTGMFYKPSGFADTVYAIRESDMTGKELTMVSALQGILAQNKATIYIEGSEGATAERLSEMSVKYSFSVEYVNDAWSLIRRFAGGLGGKYVLYNDASDVGVSYADQSVNYASVIASVEHYLMIPKSEEKAARAAGLTLGADATELNTRSVFETYKDRLNTGFIVHQSPTVRYLRDYAIAGKAMCFYSDYYDGDSSVKMDILEWADKNAPVLGWTDNEINFVSANSLMSKVTIAADWAANLSFYAAAQAEPLKQENYGQRTIVPEKGKHYVAVVMSDGDNVQWMTRGFASNSKYFGSSYRGEFPMTWTTSPALYDLAPDILSGFYDGATAFDQFIAGPSGVGYINATEYARESLGGYAAYTAGYMEKTGIEYVNLLDNYTDESVLKSFSSYPQIKGGVWSVGNKYLEGGGALYWSDDKPFISVRETLWRIAGDDASNQYYGFVERVAQRINGYKRDYTTVEGYTVVLAHAWSIGTMDYISRFMSALDEDVVPVTLGEMLTMISENVGHENAVPDDIAPDYFDGALAPISSEQIDWRQVKDTPVTELRDFSFPSKRDLGGWLFGTGGLEYDYAGWISSDTAGTPSIMLDGSDLEDVLDPLPNAWTYNMFALSADEKADNWLTLWITGGNSADVNMRVRALYEEYGEVKAVVLESGDYEKPLDEYGWYLRNGASPFCFTYDLASLKGKKILLSIEQDDSGDGSGEIVYINRIAVTSSLVEKETLTSWNISDISEDWTVSGSVGRHTEGVCLEAAEGESAIIKDLTITEEYKILKFYVRMFVRSENPDTPPKLKLYVNGVLVRAELSENDYVTARSDKYRCIAFDLSAYIGQTVTVKFVSEEGEHAAVGKIILCEAYATGELKSLYTIESLKTM